MKPILNRWQTILFFNRDIVRLESGMKNIHQYLEESQKELDGFFDWADQIKEEEIERWKYTN